MAVSQPSGGKVRWANVQSLAREEEEKAGDEGVALVGRRN